MSDDAPPAVGRVTHPAVVTLLVAAVFMSGVVTVLLPGLLTGPPAMNGSAQGTALVMTLGGAPLLAVAYGRSGSGSLVALTLAAGAAAYLVYNAVLLVFATPLNQAFPLYEAVLGLGIWTLTGLVREIWVAADLARPVGRWIPAYILGVVVLNLVAWLQDLVPGLLSDEPRAMLDGTGLTTNPVYVQDLAFWLPCLAWIAVGMWQAHGPRTALGAAALCYWVLEAAGVAVDQWWGHRADPTSQVVSSGIVPLFVVVGVLTVWPLVSVLKDLAGAPRLTGNGRPGVPARAVPR